MQNVGLRKSTQCGKTVTMSQVSEFADAIGRQKLAQALDVGPTAVSNAVVRGCFPSSWFLVCQGLAREAGIACAPDLFRMRPAEGPRGTDTDGVHQGAPSCP